MANLSSLVHELRERIAASSSTPSSRSADDDALEVRFRAVLPNLLHAYVVPSSSANEREVIAVVKLISHTARNFPGVFYHGKASAILPIIGRILPFFAEPAFRSRHGVIFETLGSLLSLLRTGARDAYRQFFADAMLVIEDIQLVASLCLHNASAARSTRLTLKCFCESFNGIFSDPDHIGDLPAHNKPVDGYGVLIDLSSKKRWRPFAAWILKLLSKCLTEGTLYIEGLINAPFVSSACCLLCYGDADLHMACFDFARIIGMVTNYDITPYQNLIQSMSTIMSEDKEGLPVFRSTAYDSSMGICLNALYSSCPEEVVKSTAVDLVSVFLPSIRRTKSQELKVALCGAYVRIAKICPPHIWQPESLIFALFHPEPFFSLVECFQVALSILGPDLVGGIKGNIKTPSMLTSEGNSTESSRIGQKRPIQDVNNSKIKRQKLNEEVVVSDASLKVQCKYSHIVTCQREDYATHMNKSLLSFVCLLNAPDIKASSLRPDIALPALSMLSIAFSSYPETNLSFNLFQQMLAWLRWLVEQAKQGSSIKVDIFTYLEGIHSILLSQNASFMENKALQHLNQDEDLVIVLLKLPWTHTLLATDHHCAWQTKVLSLKIASKLGPNFSSEVLLEVLDLGLHDEAEEVRTEAVISMPVMVFWSGLNVLSSVFRRMEVLLFLVCICVLDGLNDENLIVRYMVACELRKLLNLRWKDVTTLITAEAGSDLDVLSSLITSLLKVL